MLRDIAAMAPAWQGAHQETGADRALVEAGARLAEEATKRLDRTPERDALAFFDMFDVPPPKPVAAEGFAVFALKEDQTEPVPIPARTGVEIETLAGEKAPFETAEDLRAQPTRIARLATLEPRADRIELAPGAVTTLEPDLTPRPAYRLATAAGPDARAIALTPPVGIAPGDLLRIGAPDDSDPIYAEVVAFSEDGLTELKAPLDGTGVEAGTVVERMTRLDAFAMPDEQEHGLYIGDADVLNVKEPATLTLRFVPADTAALLRDQGARFEIWGTREQPNGDAEPGWRPLVPLAAGGDDLTLLKAWTGPVDEVEIGGRKARWLRIVPAGRITPEKDGPHSLTRPAAVNKMTIGIETEKPEGGQDDTVSQVAHNGLPLSRATSFLPFGAEPQRFDSFALAAPEAFTKRGAAAVLDFELLDATPLTVSHAVRFDAERHLYGIGRNGRLQVMQLGRDEILWREFAGPGEEGDPAAPQRLDPAFGVHAFGRMMSDDAFANDLVVVRTENGGLYSAGIDHKVDAATNDDSAVEHKGWQPLPDLPEGTLEDGEVPTLVAAPRRQSPAAADLVGHLYAAARSGLHFMQLNDDGSAPDEGWQSISISGNAPELPASPRFVHVVDPGQANEANPVSCLAVDRAGDLWVLSANQQTVFGQKLKDGASAPFGVVSDAQPAGLLYEEGENTRLAVAAISAGGMTIWKLDGPLVGAGFIAARSHPVDIGAGAHLAVVPGLAPANTDFPHVLAFDRGGSEPRIVEWAPDGLVPGADVVAGDAAEGLVSTHRVARGLLPSDEAAAGRAAIFAPAAGIPDALIALGGADQSVLQLRINPSFRLDLFDWIEVPEQAGFSEIGIIRSTGDGRELLFDDDIDIVCTDLDGVPIAVISDRDTDWGQSVQAFRSDAGKSVTLDTSGTKLILRGDPNTASDALGDEMILVVPNPPLPSGPLTFGLFKVDVVNVDETTNVPDIVVVEQDMLAGLMADATEATWRHVSLSTEIPGGTDDRRRLSLVEIPDGLDIPDFAGLFERAQQVAPFLALTDTGGRQLYLLAGGWPGTIEQGHQIKAAFIGSGAEAIAIESLAAPYSNPRLSWEYFNGKGWKRLDQAFHDGTADFANSGEVAFTVPRDLQPSEIGGQEDYWIRARLVGGDYGRPRYIVKQTGKPTHIEQEVTVSTDHMRPPEIASVTARFTLPPDLPDLVVARNNLQDLDQSSANGLASASYAMFQGAFAPPLAGDDDDPDRHARAILLGLTRPLEPGSASLFVVARDQAKEVSIEISTLGADNRWSPAPLTDDDPTKGLNRSGLLRFAVTARPARIQLLGAALHWLRIRAMGDGAASWAPRIEGLWLNGVSVVQAETVRHEPLGSADGEPGFEVQLLKKQVLPDTLELRVRERLGDEEVEALRVQGGEDAVQEEVPNLPGQWVRWTRVESLADQPGDARVFLADASGTVRFGDGQNGRLVLAGRDNLRAFNYQSGGQRIETAAFAPAGPRGSIEALETVLAPALIAGGRDIPKPAAQGAHARCPAPRRTGSQPRRSRSPRPRRRQRDRPAARVSACSGAGFGPARRSGAGRKPGAGVLAGAARRLAPGLVRADLRCLAHGLSRRGVGGFRQGRVGGPADRGAGRAGSAGIAGQGDARPVPARCRGGAGRRRLVAGPSALADRYQPCAGRPACPRPGGGGDHHHAGRARSRTGGGARGDHHRRDARDQGDRRRGS
ncbi:MAG: hypothetical protein R3D30_12440 [Hyphomicrobiales bacterium]